MNVMRQENTNLLKTESAEITQGTCDDNQFSSWSPPTYYLIFWKGRPLGIAYNKSELDQYLKDYPGATYDEYSMYGPAARAYENWVNKNKMEFIYDDGGRKAAGYKGDAGDCVTRSISIVTGKPYQEVYDALNVLAKSERITKRNKRRSSARDGVSRSTSQKYLESIGYKWIPTMHIGKGCTVHLRKGELPEGRIVVNLSKHFSAVIDGVIHDTHDCGREGTRCVYGYYIKKDSVI